MICESIVHAILVKVLSADNAPLSKLSAEMIRPATTLTQERGSSRRQG